MSIEESLIQRERSLVARLLMFQAGIDDRTGKGAAAENVIQEELLQPFLPPGFACAKGAVVSADTPTEQSPAIDRVIFDRIASMPLVSAPEHSIFPIESVAGMVEITMRLDATKLGEDIARMHPVKGMRVRRYLVPEPNSRINTIPIRAPHLSPRSFIIGHPADPGWSPQVIAEALRRIQRERGPHTHVHGLYVIGTGFFITRSVDENTEQTYRIRGWTGPDRLFRFAQVFRQSFDRWKRLPEGWSVDLSGYVQGDPTILAE